ncbi:MAG: exodeoxyribonuclease VII large subunit [Desulfatiglans sp.]|nr:exodeoxyribonuclease VII large subunit [Thermodesulfobacteriota bacterium]MEE4353291.1 exodeoxyribonuclease VII large subunit [Desulfatiglans sp.]
MSRVKESPKVYSVSELTGEIQDLLEERFAFVWVEGEVSNFRSPVSGHYYMVLKDEKAQLRAVMFRMQARYLKFVPEDGIKVVAQGRIGVYPPRGEYQIILDYIEPMGVGALALAFEQLKKKLAAQGLFAQEAKKEIPFLPTRIAVITSPTGAAIRDFLRVIHRRFANIEIIVVPARVQGDEATADLVEALDLVNRFLDVDVVVLTRGGGSLEDLWAFNREELAFAIRRSEVPVVSAVGHEVDITISDLAADLRAPTPSAAAEILVVEKRFLLEQLEEIRGRLESAMVLKINILREKTGHISRGLRDPRKRLSDTWMRLDEIHARLLRLLDMFVADTKRRLGRESRALFLHSPLTMRKVGKERLDFQKNSLIQTKKKRLQEIRAALSLSEKRLHDLSPQSILKRGYSITRELPRKRVLRNTHGVKKGGRVQVILGEGRLECGVDKVLP